MAYSVDLRELVLNVLREEGITQEVAAQRFRVSVSSVKRWLHRKSLTAGKPGPRGPRIDVVALKKAVEDKPDAYLDEYAKMLNTSSSTVSYNLLKLGIRRKKNDTLPRTRRRQAQDIPARNGALKSG